MSTESTAAPCLLAVDVPPSGRRRVADELQQGRGVDSLWKESPARIGLAVDVLEAEQRRLVPWGCRRNGLRRPRRRPAGLVRFRSRGGPAWLLGLCPLATIPHRG